MVPEAFVHVELIARAKVNIGEQSEREIDGEPVMQRNRELISHI
jgi:hypothetical protein